ncbi:antibiotic biosynthesis monooxygenase [Nocardioides panacis]|uniref:Antibiotic biosynthesis monooxygenase n=1 Tax=Nocardioides panacis TaxID=2849501 RepID=A0A975T1W5_9ACTN|nr:antibiotic biosynthesis monooxygenase [Nocardioides panacis]QWZ10052.1 antibiotic biosynthesis monooxygenase [Nocardioides panacis]
MHARTTTLQAEPGKIDDGIAYVRNEVLPRVTDTDGCVGMSLLVDRESGRCIATTAWESEEALRASAETVRPLREAAERALGSTGSSVDTWEVAVVHRDHALPEGAFARVTWLSGDSNTADRAVEMFRMGVLPKVQELPGFCSASLLVSAEAGRAVGTVMFETREQLVDSREAATRIRSAASKEAAATVDDVAEMEVAFAHLHVPEMA